MLYGFGLVIVYYCFYDRRVCYYENAVKCVVEHLKKGKCILMGDFNVLPDDSVLLPIRERMRDTADIFDAAMYSFSSDKPDRKLDYIFVSKDIEVASADIPDIIVSDHRPHTAKICF